ncbi:FAD-binding domain-containing protein [Setomelanomma holmii]|uniref:FAD-binding domain-containing protein n=1 Tax=Setomelanomma holmii TaxID=210430 RepID=A0A9P4LFP8_9PLEO|nr:FAD-binding domain-containing protein [Setomelanomma holmii]
MTSTMLLTSAAVVLVTSIFIAYRLQVRSSKTRRDAEAEKPNHLNLDASLSESALRLRKNLMAVLPDSIIIPANSNSFKKSMDAYWAQQACEVPPGCVVQPRNAQELSQAIRILKSEYDERMRVDGSLGKHPDGLFAVRSGGHSPVAGASSIQGGAVIDLSLFDEVTPAADGKSVAIGAGCKWVQVYNALQAKSLAVAGGRNSQVGVGGLTLGGGLSFFSPRFGIVCSNITEYEIVLADGSIVKASEASNPDLWRALKGGSNNFGIVTRFTARSFPAGDIWSGFLYLLPSQALKVLTSFREFLDRVISNDEGKVYDEHAAGPLACFTYLQALGVQAIAVALTHTRTPQSGTKWPACWQSSGFSKLWRLWSTCSVKSLPAATNELSVLNPPGRRQEFATTTIKNDQATLEATHQAYCDAIARIRKRNIKNMSWTLVLQPMLPDWARKGDPNVLGLDTCTDEPLVNVSFTVNWALSKDDEIVQGITRAAIEQIDAFATEHGTAHRYRYLNYCDSWQRPFDGYGKANLEFMREVSRKYDPEGLFQRGCAGGFKLGLCDGGR